MTLTSTTATTRWPTVKCSVPTADRVEVMVKTLRRLNNALVDRIGGSGTGTR